MTTTYAKAPYCVRKPSVLRCAPRDQIGQRKYLSEITAVAAFRRASPPLPSPDWIFGIRAAYIAARRFRARAVGRLLVSRGRGLLRALRSRRRQRAVVSRRRRGIAGACRRTSRNPAASASDARRSRHAGTRTPPWCSRSDVARSRVPGQTPHSRRNNAPPFPRGARGRSLMAARRGASGRVREQVELRRSPRDDASRRFVEPVEGSVTARVARGGFAGERERHENPLANVGRLSVQPEEQQLGGRIGEMVEREKEKSQ